EEQTPANQKFMAAYRARYKADPDQFAAQAYDAMYIVAEALKKVAITGDVMKDRAALTAALPGVKFNGATGDFTFRRAPSAAGKQVGYDAQQDAIVNIAKGGKFVSLK
ncbi:MAG TPA: ABC transporter substrate-binding protein, partial [Burkholderiaceae bacterium]